MARAIKIKQPAIPGLPNSIGIPTIIITEGDGVYIKEIMIEQTLGGEPQMIRIDIRVVEQFLKKVKFKADKLTAKKIAITKQQEDMLRAAYKQGSKPHTQELAAVCEFETAAEE